MLYDASYVFYWFFNRVGQVHPYRCIIHLIGRAGCGIECCASSTDAPKFAIVIVGFSFYKNACNESVGRKISIGGTVYEYHFSSCKIRWSDFSVAASWEHVGLGAPETIGTTLLRIEVRLCSCEGKPLEHLQIYVLPNSVGGTLPCNM